MITLGALIGMYCPDQDAFRSCMRQIAQYAKHIHIDHFTPDRMNDTRERRLTAPDSLV